MIRLRDLDPRQVGEEVTRLVLDHLHIRALDVGMELRESGPSSLGFSTALLTDWAQHGTNGEAWDEGMAWDAVQQVCEALYSRPGEPGTFGSGPIDQRSKAEPESAVEVVLLAAWARQCIAQRTDVPVRALACLAGLSVGGTRNLGPAGELTIHDGLVAPEEARRWLSGRGVDV